MYMICNFNFIKVYVCIWVWFYAVIHTLQFVFQNGLWAHGLNLGEFLPNFLNYGIKFNTVGHKILNLKKNIAHNTLSFKIM